MNVARTRKQFGGDTHLRIDEPDSLRSEDKHEAHLRTVGVSVFRFPLQRSAGKTTPSVLKAVLVLDEGEHFADSVVKSDK